MAKRRSTGKRLPAFVSRESRLIVRSATSRPRSSITATTSRGTISVGESAVIEAKVDPAESRPIRLERLAAGEWTSIADGWTSPIGEATFTDHPVAGRVTYRLMADATRTAEATESNQVIVDVVDAPKRAASLQVVVTGLPDDAAGQVTVTGPGGERHELTDDAVITPAEPGRWTVTAVSRLVGLDTFHPVRATQQVDVTAHGHSSTTVDYGVVVPESTSVIDPTEIADVVELPDGLLRLEFTPSAAAARRAQVAARTRIAERYVDGQATSPSLLSRDLAGQTMNNCVSTTFVLCEGDIAISDVNLAIPALKHGLLGRVPVGGVGTNWVNVDPRGVTLMNAIKSGSLGDNAKAISVARQAEHDLGHGLSCSEGATGEVAAGVEITPTLDVGIRIGWGGLEEAHAIAEVKQSAELGVSVNGEAKCSLERRSLFSRTLPAFRAQIGPVPVVLVPKLDLMAEADVSATGRVDAGWSEEARGRAGLRYENGAFHHVNDVNLPTLNSRVPTFNAEANATVSLTPQVNVSLYGVAGPTVGLKGSLIGMASASPGSLEWSVRGKVDVVGSFDVPALGKSTGELHLGTLYDQVLVQGSVPGWEPPPGYHPRIVTTDLPDAVVGVPYSERLETEDNRNGNWSLDAGQLPTGLSLDPGTGVISGAPTVAQADRTYTFRFIDGYGRSATKDVSMSVLAESAVTWLPEPVVVTGIGVAPEYAVNLNTLREGTDWAVVHGSLPPGMSLAPSGRVTGLPRYEWLAGAIVRVAYTDPGLARRTVLVGVEGVDLYAVHACTFDHLPAMGPVIIGAMLGQVKQTWRTPHLLKIVVNGDVKLDRTVYPGDGDSERLWSNLNLPTGQYDFHVEVDGQLLVSSSQYCAPQPDPRN